MLRIFSCAFWPSVCLLWRNVSLDLLPIFQLGCLFFLLLLSSMSYLYNLEIKPLSVMLFANTFSHSVGYFFISFVVSFAVQKIVTLSPICLFLFLFLLPWETDLRKHWYDLCQRIFCLCSLVGESCLMFESLSHFEFILGYNVRVCSNFIDLHAAIQFSQNHLLKRRSFSHCIVSLPLLKVH